MEVYDYSKSNLFNTWHPFSTQALKPEAQKHANAADESRADLFNEVCFEYRALQKCNAILMCISGPSPLCFTLL